MKPLSEWDYGATWLTFPQRTFHQEYHGLELQKCMDDLDRYREIVSASKPDIVVETGTRYGGSALWFHHELGLEVVTVDVAPQVKPSFNRPGLKSIRGSSISDWVFETLLKDVRGKRVMVSLDSDHHSPHVQAEIARLSTLVSKGCYLVVEDACFDMFHRHGYSDWARVGGGKIPEIGGTLHALEMSRIEESAHWTRDTEIEGRTPVSHSPCGWWRRND